jgi:hypothetical protein
MGKNPPPNGSKPVRSTNREVPVPETAATAFKDAVDFRVAATKPRGDSDAPLAATGSFDGAATFRFFNVERFIIVFDPASL